MRFHRSPRVRNLLTAALGVAAATTTASAQLDCLTLPVDRPAPLVGLAALGVYDSTRGVHVVFWNDGLGRVFEWHGDSWDLIVDATPFVWLITRHAAVTFDSLRGRTLIFASPTFHAWDGDEFTLLPPLPEPMPLLATAMTYDSARDVVVLFGGDRTSDQGEDTNNTWEFDGVEWTLVEPATRPPVRRNAVMSYDSDRGVCVLFGGASGPPVGSGPTLLRDTWEWDGVDWTERTVEIGVNPPGGRLDGLTMAYDPVRQRTFLIQNEEFIQNLASFWEWDGETWTSRETGLTQLTTPELVFDTTNQVLRLTTHPQWGGTRFLSSPEPPIITQSPTNAEVTSGQPVQFTVAAMEGDPGLGALAYQWRQNGVAIPSADQATYTIGSAALEDQGAYDCLVTYDGFFTDCGATLSGAATLTVTSDCPSDLDGNEDIGFGDILQILTNWGPCP